jgi:hypothetical protein
VKSGSYGSAIKLGATALGAVTGIGAPVVGGVLSLLEGAGLSFETKSVAGWDRTIGRFYRAGAPAFLTRWMYQRFRSEDPTGSKLWELAVDNVPIATEKQSGQTKKGYTRNPPIPVVHETSADLKAYLQYVKG